MNDKDVHLGFLSFPGSREPVPSARAGRVASDAICQPQVCRQPDVEMASSEGREALEGTVSWAIEGLHLCSCHHGEHEVN